MSKEDLNYFFQKVCSSYFIDNNFNKTNPNLRNIKDPLNQTIITPPNQVFSQLNPQTIEEDIRNDDRCYFDEEKKELMIPIEILEEKMKLYCDIRRDELESYYESMIGDRINRIDLSDRHVMPRDCHNKAIPMSFYI